jgi:hypothetical protein
MKQIKKIIKFQILALVLIVFYQCSSVDYVLVRTHTKNNQAINLNNYAKIYYTDFVVDFSENSSNGYDPKNDIKQFFLEDLAKNMQISIDYLPEKITDVSDQSIIKNLSAHYPNSLIITGKMNINVKKRSIIKDFKKESGKKSKKFIQIEHWDFSSKTILIDTAKEAILHAIDYKKIISDVDPDSPKYNFEKAFFNSTHKLLFYLQSNEKKEERYLIIE